MAFCGELKDLAIYCGRLRNQEVNLLTLNAVGDYFRLIYDLK